MPRKTLVDDLLDRLGRLAQDALVDFVANYHGMTSAQQQREIRQPRARRVGKAPKTKKTKPAKPSARERQQTHYQTLEVIDGASPETINAAFRSLCQRNHPDKFPNDARARKHAEERCKAFTEAHAVLKDPAKRREYNATLRKGTYD